MIAFRSHLYNVLFYINLLGWLIGSLPVLAMTRKVALRYSQGWAGSCVWLLRVVVGTRLEVRGLERSPPGGLLVASKHQSFFETFALLYLLDDPAFIYKKELKWLPGFGWLLQKTGQVPVNRGGATALVEMNRAVRQEVRNGRQIVIFPEGTRRAPGAEPAYRNGVAHIYRNLRVPCVPVALNSGVFWPRRRYIRRPGTIVIDFGAPIPPGLKKDEFTALLIQRIEDGSDALLAEAGGAPVPPGYAGPDGI